MTRLLLLVFILLFGLLVVDRIGHIRAAPSAPATVMVARAPASRMPSASATTAAEPRSEGTPAMDLLARLEGRRRLARAAATTYFDSLFIETDSLVRRWPDDQGLRFNVAVVTGDSAEYDAVLLDVIARAATVWEGAGLGMRFTVSSDSNGAQIVAHSTRQLGVDRVGQTDLQWTGEGAIRSATITMARLDKDGRALPGAAVLAVAVHEIGHALGLAHSPVESDVMYPTTKTGTLSGRDRATFTLLYELPLGTIREVIK